MCFASLNGNKLTFSLPTRWKATVQVSFSGTNKKLALIEWDSLNGQVSAEQIYYCDNPSGGTCSYENSAAPIATEISVFYATEPCGGAAPTVPVTQSSESDCQAKSVKQWGTWVFECPDTGDTVGIAVMIEDEVAGDD